jgi:hypothetical protein
VARRRGERGDELVEEHVAQALEGRDRDGALEAGQRRLAGQVVLVRGAVGEELEDRICAKRVVVILVLVAGQDAVDAGTDQLQEAVIGEVGVPGSSRASAKAWMNPMRWSNWRTGSSPASLESWPGDGSRASGVPKKSRTCGQRPGKLMCCLPGCKNRPDDLPG